MARGFFSRFVFIFIFWNHLFLVCGYFGVEILVFLMKGIFFLITGTILVHVEIELFPVFGLIPSPPCGSMESIMFVGIVVCVCSWHALSFNFYFFGSFVTKAVALSGVEYPSITGLGRWRVPVNQLEIILDLPFGFPINNIISLTNVWPWPSPTNCLGLGIGAYLIVTTFFLLLLLCRHTASPPITAGTHTGGV